MNFNACFITKFLFAKGRGKIMKKNISMYIAICSSILTIICIFKITALKNQINNMQSNVSGQLVDVNNSISSIYNNFNNILQKGASILADSSYQYGEVNIENKTVELIFNATPKEYSKAGTTSILMLDNQEYPMKLEEGKFTTKIVLPLFSDYGGFKVIFMDGDVLRTEYLDWNVSPRNDYLPEVEASLSGSFGSSSPYSIEGDLHVYVAPNKESVGFKSFYLIEMIDGKEVNRTNFEPDNPVNGMYYNARHNIKETYDIPKGSTHELFVEAVDQYNLHYRTLVNQAICDENGKVHSNNNGRGYNKESSIYDADGNKLY